MTLRIVRSEAKSWFRDDSSREYAPEKAYDGDVSTWYSVKDHYTAGNFLKLYLSEKSYIATVKLTNRGMSCCQERIIGTVAMVYSTESEGGEIKVADCGEEIQGEIWFNKIINSTRIAPVKLLLSQRRDGRFKFPFSSLIVRKRPKGSFVWTAT